jgi:hypothetical protein
MNANLDKIALDLYGKIQTRFPNIKIGDENAGVLSKKTDIPKARFFEFEYKDQGKTLGTIAITLDEDDGVVVQVSGSLADSKHPGAYKFIRSFRSFARDRLLNFDVQNIGKNNLDKRDYTFQAKPKELPAMEPIMESSMYGTSRMSYQDLGEATLIIKHTQPVNTDLAAGRTMHIESIWVENAQGERFKYPFKHLNGARALAEHLKHGGIPYDAIGKHITSLSEELAQLRKFKGYVNRNEALSEAMGDITSKVMERIDVIKKEVHGLQRTAYYETFAEAFTEREEQMIPEEIMSDWIDRLTIRTFNEDLRTAFPYIFKLVDESNIPVKELSPDDILGEDDEFTTHKGGKVTKKDGVTRHEKRDYSENPSTFKDKDEDKLDSPQQRHKMHKAVTPDVDEAYNPNSVDAEHRRSLQKASDEKSKAKDPVAHAKKLKDREAKNQWYQDQRMERESYDPEAQFESFIDSIVNEDEAQTGENELFSADVAKQSAAVEKLKDLLAGGLTPGVNGSNGMASLKGIIDSPMFAEKLNALSDDDNVGTAVKIYLQELMAGKEDPSLSAPGLADPAHIAQQIFATNALDSEGETPVGGEDMPPVTAEPGPEAALPSAAPEATAEVPPAATAEVPPAVPGEEVPPAPVAESTGMSKLKVKLIKAMESGATLDTKLDFGCKVITLGEAMEECGMDPHAVQGSTEEHEDPIHSILKSISGFWNPQEKNFTIGGTKAKIKVLKDFKDGMYPHAQPEHVKKVIAMIEKMDPSTSSHQEHSRMKELAGVPHHEAEVAEDGQAAPFDMNVLLQQLKALQDNPEQVGQQAKQVIGQQLQQVQKDVPNQTVQLPGGQINPQEMMKALMQKMQGNM